MIQRVSRWGRVVGWALFTVVALAEAALLAAIIVYGYRDHVRPAGAIIVLGAGIGEDGAIKPTTRVRAEHGAALWAAGVAPVVICAGGATGPTPRTEADTCREVLVEAGVDPAAILLEERSNNTEQNARYTLDLMQAEDITSAVVVSSRYHLLRARWLFWRQAPETLVVTSPAQLDHLFPHQIVYSYLRDLLAFHWQFVRELFDLPHIRVPVP